MYFHLDVYVKRVTYTPRFKMHDFAAIGIFVRFVECPKLYPSKVGPFQSSNAILTMAVYVLFPRIAWLTDHQRHLTAQSFAATGFRAAPRSDIRFAHPSRIYRNINKYKKKYILL